MQRKSRPKGDSELKAYRSWIKRPTMPTLIFSDTPKSLRSDCCGALEPERQEKHIKIAPPVREPPRLAAAVCRPIFGRALFRFLSKRELSMHSSPSIVPGIDQAVYLVVDDFGHHGQSWRESNVGDTDRETVVCDLLEGQYINPALVVCFNVAEGWCRDVSEDIAVELRKRCSDQKRDVPTFLEEFIFRHGKTLAR
jgi:hypothetical protein